MESKYVIDDTSHYIQINKTTKGIFHSAIISEMIGLFYWKQYNIISLTGSNS